MTSRVFLLGAVTAIVLLSATACSRSPYDLVKVTGTVTVDGKPTEALVNFFPENKEHRGAIGQAGTDGTFAMGTMKAKDGAVPGKHRVAISPKTPPPMSGSARMVGNENAEAYVSPFPERYGNPETSGFEVEVRKGEKNNFTFDIKTD